MAIATSDLENSHDPQVHPQPRHRCACRGVARLRCQCHGARPRRPPEWSPKRPSERSPAFPPPGLLEALPRARLCAAGWLRRARDRARPVHLPDQELHAGGHRGVPGSMHQGNGKRAGRRQRSGASRAGPGELRRPDLSGLPEGKPAGRPGRDEEELIRPSAPTDWPPRGNPRGRPSFMHRPAIRHDNSRCRASFLLDLMAANIIYNMLNIHCSCRSRKMPISRSIVQACLVLAMLPASLAQADDRAPPGKISFYFAAHEDDWQLFMNPSAFQDVINGAAKTVFVHMTAGDAGRGIGSDGRKHPFYLERENGAETAIRFMADADDIPADRIAGHMSFNGHSIYRVSYRNTVSYFLRVPDGSPQGTGYEGTCFQSLKRMADGDNNILSAIDGSTVYHGWNDLVSTVRKIVDFERGRAGAIQFNVAELDARINPNDHSDHLMTAKAALDAVQDLACVRRVYYVDYASSRLPENLNAQQRDMESSVFAVTLAGVLAFDHRTSWHHYDKSFVGRNYFRVQEGAGRCEASGTEIAAVRH